MPKQTFFNLPESKRQAIVDIAVEEFANNDYRNASISRIVARAGIAKGSLYQYFADKRDLFMYLVDLAVQQKMEFLQQSPPEPGMSFFDYMRWLTVVGTKATIIHPQLAKVAYRAYYGDLPFHDDVIARLKETSLQYFEKMVRDAIAKGDVDPGVDPEMAVFVANTLMMELGNYIFRRQGLDPPRVGREGVELIDMDLVEKTFDDFMRVLQYGLANRKRKEQRQPTMRSE
ncbi:MAG: TetR/AcrR family transcriptional regulator [Chloroflexota bacterium]